MASGEDREAGNAATGTTTITWTAPASRENGDPISLSDISAYQVHYGTSSGNYSESIQFQDDGTNARVLTELAPGTYYVAMRVRDTDGNTSNYSEEIVVTIP